MINRIKQAAHLSCLVFAQTARYGTQNSLKSALDKKSIQFTSKHLKQALEQKDVVFYQAPAGVGRTFMWMYISAGVQLMFW
jgi:hypothetical protein